MSPRRLGSVALGCALVLSVPSACSLSRRESGAVEAYLGCIECDRGELDSVRALALRKPHATLRALERVLLHGVDSQRLAALDPQLARLWVLTYGPIAVPDSFVVFYRTAHDIGYRRNAAIALGWIGTPLARSVLHAGLQAGLHPRLLGVIQYALDSLPP